MSKQSDKIRDLQKIGFKCDAKNKQFGRWVYFMVRESDGKVLKVKRSGYVTEVQNIRYI